ncbi:MAG: InlB B-repeat-containing protein [Coriobacteriales bacterium]|jgi:uncharacterized repeat protein (TIGR02543 family)|nr:InlB B-repeat-containing protein [Coriobacteriales bacterium]
MAHTRTTFRKALAVLLAAVLALSLGGLAPAYGAEGEDSGDAAAGVAPQEVIASGNCGADGSEGSVTWSLDGDGTLTITGSGAMGVYNYAARPWGSYGDAITHVVITGGVTSVGGRAFAGYGSLSSVDISVGVQSIQSEAFRSCTSLKSVTIPSSVYWIGDFVFGGCTSLVSIVVDDDNAYYSTDGQGALFDNGKTELLQYPMGSPAVNYSIPSSVNRIAQEAFNGCRSLSSIFIPSSVSSVIFGAFQYCTATIYCKASSKPSGWDSEWDGDHEGEVFWGQVEAGLLYSVRAAGEAGAAYGDGAYVTGYRGASGAVSVPATLGGRPVVSVELNGVNLSSLDVSACGAALRSLSCFYDGLTELDVSKSTGLVRLDCSDNLLESLDVGGSAALEELDCSGNRLSSLSVGANAKLERLNCAGNLLAALDVSKNAQLAWLSCSNNRLTALDVSAGANPKLSWLACAYNRIPDSAARRVLVARFGDSSILPQDAPAPCAVAFDSRGGSTVAGRAVAAGSAVGALSVPVRTGHAFLGWFTAPSGGARVTASTVVSGGVTYYAQWRANTYTVTFKGFDGRVLAQRKGVAHGTAATAPKASGRAGHTFTGWDRAFGSVTSDLTVTAKYRANTYTVKLDASGGRLAAKAASFKKTYGQALGRLAAKPVRTGYTFQGWFTGKAGGMQPKATAKVTRNLTYYAHWKANGPVVTLNANGGKVGKTATASVVKKKGAAVGTLAKPVRTGYDFLGWYTGKAKGTKVTARTAVTRNVTCYAHWKAKTYTVKLNANGGKVGKATATSLKKSYNTRLGKLSTPKRTGYTFLGWYTAKSGGTKVNSATRVTKAVTLYAHWKRAR